MKIGELVEHVEIASLTNIEVFINNIILTHLEVDKQEKKRKTNIYIYIYIYIFFFFFN